MIKESSNTIMTVMSKQREMSRKIVPKERVTLMSYKKRE